MFCFWTGEHRLGSLDGVIATEAGWLDGHEVTLVDYDRAAISFADLVKAAASYDCARKIFTQSDSDLAIAKASRLATGSLDASYRPAAAKDQKRQILGSAWQRLGLSPTQATKVNAHARTDPEKAAAWLSPRQLAQLYKQK